MPAWSQFSPANTSKTLSDYPDKGLYFRTAPSDILQGAVLGEVIAGDGHASVAIIARNDSYGTGLVEDATAALQEAGVEVVETKIYAEDAQTFDAEVGGVRRQPGGRPADLLQRGLEDPDHDGGAGRRARRTSPVYLTDGSIGNAARRGLRRRRVTLTRRPITS